METVLGLFDALPAWLVAITTLVAAAAGIAALTPTPKDDAFWLKVRKVLDVLAMNFGHAKNAKPEESSGAMNGKNTVG